jgi:hypothetical protein
MNNSIHPVLKMLKMPAHLRIYSRAHSEYIFSIFLVVTTREPVVCSEYIFSNFVWSYNHEPVRCVSTSLAHFGVLHDCGYGLNMASTA